MERYYNFGGEGVMAAAAAGARTVLEVNAPVIDHAGSAKARSTARSSSSPCAGGASASARAPTSSSRRAPRSSRGTRRRERSCGSSGAPIPTGSARTLLAPPPFERPATTVAIFAGAFRSWHGAINLVRAMRELHARGRSDVGAVLVGDGPELPAVQDEAAGLAERRLHRRRAARRHAGVPGRGRHRRRAVRDRRAPAAVARVLLVAAQDLRVHGRRPSRRRAGRRSDPVTRRRRPRGPPVRPDAARRPRQRARSADRPGAPTNARPRRPRARRPRVQLEGALRGARYAIKAL